MRSPPGLIVTLLCLPSPVVAQAPAWADLWRVAAGTLSQPAALAAGPSAAFWNPAAVTTERGLAAGVDVVQTPDAANVSGMLLGATLRLPMGLSVGAIAGRLAVGDLVRTSTSPVADGADIQVFSQFVGASAGARVGPVAVGGSLLLHHARLDTSDEGGATVDVGVRITPLAGLVLAAATHLGEPVATGGAASGYVLGVEYAFPTRRFVGAPARTLLRYGLTLREAGGTEHLGSGGLLIAERLLVDLGVLWSSGYGSSAWEPVLGLAFRAGAYRVGIARGGGASGIGAAYRITLGFGGGP
jgi:hypothetical protein